MSEAEIIGQDDLETRRSRREVEAARMSAEKERLSRERASRRVIFSGRVITGALCAIGLYVATEAADSHQEGTAYRTVEVLAAYDSDPATDPGPLADRANQSNTDRNLCAAIAGCILGAGVVVGLATRDYVHNQAVITSQVTPAI